MINYHKLILHTSVFFLASKGMKQKQSLLSKSCLERICQHISKYLLTDGKKLCSPAKRLKMRAAYGISPLWPPNSTSVCSYSCTTRVSVSECKSHKPPGKPFSWNSSRVPFWLRREPKRPSPQQQWTWTALLASTSDLKWAKPGALCNPHSF